MPVDGDDDILSRGFEKASGKTLHPVSVGQVYPLGLFCSAIGVKRDTVYGWINEGLRVMQRKSKQRYIAVDEWIRFMQRDWGTDNPGGGGSPVPATPKAPKNPAKPAGRSKPRST